MATSHRTRADRSTSTAEVVENIRGRIHRGELGPGDRLPAERELASRLQVSRDRVREALQALESDGYLVSRRGATGGRFVTELATPFAAWAARTEHDLDDIVDFRLAVECEACRFAARRRTDDDLHAMQHAVERLDNAKTPREYRLADVAFHGTIAIASGNERLAIAVERARGELFEPADELWKHGRIESLAEHQHILAAIRSQAAEAAAQAMAEHIERTRLELRELARRVAAT
jgi:GntR family transcriptional regulator, transcriptional repressor for pyruvate dehydrogenase complex